MRTASVIDLFCGVGGMTYGFVQEGFNVIAGIDIDPTCAYAYEKNNGAKFILKDIENLTGDDIVELFPENDIKILIGCAPCQPFSKYTNKKTEGNEWKLVRSFGELIKCVKPDIVSMENVPQLENHRVFNEFLNVLEEMDFYFSWSTVDCVRYGVPQTRKRLVLFASKFGKIKIINKTHSLQRQKTVAHVIRKLKPVVAGEVNSADPLHRASRLTDLNLRRIMNTPSGGGWKDWPDELVLQCHKKETGRHYSGVYGRMSWEQPAPTMTTQCYGLGNGRFGHPEQNRAISLREAALFQTFPKKYEFFPPGAEVHFKIIGKQIGNAVPVRLGRIVARSIKKHLEVCHV